MKKAILILCTAALLAGCQQQPHEPPAETETVLPAAETQAATLETSIPETTEVIQSESMEALLPDPTEETVELSYAAYQVVYNVLTDGDQESAVFQGIGPNGDLAWSYETQSYASAQLPRITPVGQYEDRYYLVEDGTVVALDVCTGRILFENPEFQGCPAPKAMLIDSYGFLYLAGMDRPDFFAMDPQGNTVKRMDSLSQEYCRPMEILQEGDQLTVYMESDLHGGSGRFPCEIPMDWLPQAQG